MTPLFREIKKIFPQAHIDFLTSTTFASICKNNPHIDQIIPFDRKQGKEALNLIARQFASQQYDLVFDAHQSLRSRLLLKKSFGWFGSGKTQIFRIDKRSWQRNLLLLWKINFLKDFPSQREAYCQLLQKFADPEQLDSSSELYPSAAERERVHQILEQNNLLGETLVAIGPSASFPGKCWSKDNFLELTKQLQSQGAKVLLLGGPEDIEPAWIVDNCEQKPLDLSNELSFLESAEVLSYCKLAISNDSAIVHFAEAMGTPALSIFGPTVKEFGYGAFLEHSKVIEVNLPCRPCSRNGKGKCTNKIQRQCLRDIPVERLMQAAMNVLKI